jgi:bifunctional DNA-binding transcriptional regulator/antitoxin component of YhaV-PrlF toxin-antitoxin module
MTQRLKAESIFIKDKDKSGARGSIPSAVRDFLGAKIGDKLIFEEGSDASIQRAIFRNKSARYVVVSLEPAATEQPASSPPAAQTTAMHEPQVPFSEVVRKKLEENK